MYRVYDDRTNKTLFKNKDAHECVIYINSNYNAAEGEASHIWIELLVREVFDYIVDKYKLETKEKDVMYVNALEKEVNELMKENERLQDEVEWLQEENRNL